MKGVDYMGVVGRQCHLFDIMEHLRQLSSVGTIKHFCKIQRPSIVTEVIIVSNARQRVKAEIREVQIALGVYDDLSCSCKLEVADGPIVALLAD